ncbi:MAG: class I SAM-dependent methyltransferase, partial [Longimicrobiales bacterium]
NGQRTPGGAGREPSPDPAKALLDELLRAESNGAVAARFWDGTEWHDGATSPRCTIVLKQPSAVRAIVATRDDTGRGEAYLGDVLDLEGDIEAAIAFATRLRDHDWSSRERLRMAWRALRLPRPEADGPAPRARLRGRRHSRARDRAAVTHHYDVSNEFYALWLDSRMVYTCAYFASAEQGLDAAQLNKLDYVCRKLRLRPGERVLDIGCGWGSLLIHAAREYDVHAVGITLSPAQASLARERIQQAGLTERCRVEIRDYRELDDPEAYDKVVSVGMFEHVGESRMAEYFGNAWRALKAGGVFLNHAIAGNPRTEGRSSEFARRYVFPDHDLIPISTTMRGAEEAGFEVRDVESLREHYTRTLRHWVARLEASHEAAARAANEAAYRAWRLVLAGTGRGFDIGEMNVYQSLLVKPGPGGASGLPLTREDWYGGSGGR